MIKISLLFVCILLGVSNVFSSSSESVELKKNEINGDLDIRVKPQLPKDVYDKLPEYSIEYEPAKEMYKTKKYKVDSGMKKYNDDKMKMYKSAEEKYNEMKNYQDSYKNVKPHYKKYEVKYQKPIYNRCYFRYKADSSDKTKYYVCSHGYQYHMKCGKGTVYDAKRYVCVHKY